MFKYRTISETILNEPIIGFGIVEQTFSELLNSDGPTILVFLSQLGSPFTKECVSDLRRSQSQDSTSVPIIFVFQEGQKEGEVFFKRYWPRARAIADCQGLFYKEFGIPTAGILDYLRPGVFFSAARALIKGHRFSMPSASVWQMPGMIILDRHSVLWSHHYRHVGDSPPIKRIHLFAQSLTNTPARLTNQHKPTRQNSRSTKLRAIG